MKKFLFVGALIVGLFLAGSAHAVQETDEWGAPVGKKIWLDDPTMVSKATHLNHADNAGMWFGYLVGASVATALFVWWRRKNS